MSQSDETTQLDAAPPDKTPAVASTAADLGKIRKGATRRLGDVTFRFVTSAAGVIIFVILFLVSSYLIIESIPAIKAGQDDISFELQAEGFTSFWQYVLPLTLGTLMTAVIALLFAVPLAIGVALYISHYAPARLSKSVGYVIDILAAIPSVVFGAWGFTVFAPAVVPLYEWLHKYLAFIPLFGPNDPNSTIDDPSATGQTILTAGLVLAIMILPIITSQCREIFIQTPILHQEAALALGATKWDMIKATVFPFARNGIVSAVMLGLGRALGETMAVTMVLSTGALQWNIIRSGNKTIPAEIALNYPEAFGMRQSELIAAGLVLFVITFLVNAIARWILSRYAEFSGAN